MSLVYLSLGTNLGNRGENLKKALMELERWGIRVLRASSIYESEPVGGIEQPWFYNMVVRAEVDSAISPHEVLALLQRIERSLGRDRSTSAVKWGPRIIDLDLLFYGDLVVNESPDLIIPHPQLADRKFVLVPLAEITAGLIDPISGFTVEQLLFRCKDESIVKKR